MNKPKGINIITPIMIENKETDNYYIELASNREGDMFGVSTFISGKSDVELSKLFNVYNSEKMAREFYNNTLEKLEKNRRFINVKIVE